MTDNEYIKGQIQVSKIRKGSYIVVDDKACVVASITTHKTGKHGSAKASISARDIFTDKRIDITESTSKSLPEPIVTKKDYDIIDIQDGFITLLTHDTNEQVELKNSDLETQKILKKIIYDKHIIVTFLEAMGKNRILSYKEIKDED